MRIASIALLFGVLMAADDSSQACGDKFLRVGRGARFQRGYVALHPARIVLLARPTTPVGRALKDLEPALRRAGHRTVVVDGPAGMGSALRGSTQDVVMAELDDVPSVETALQGMSAAPSILPVLHESAAARVATVEKRFACVVASCRRSGDVLAEIDGLMERRGGNRAGKPEAR